MTIWTNLVETYPRHIPAKFEVDLANGFWQKSNMWIVDADGRMIDGRAH